MVMGKGATEMGKTGGRKITSRRCDARLLNLCASARIVPLFLDSLFNCLDPLLDEAR